VRLIFSSDVTQAAADGAPGDPEDDAAPGEPEDDAAPGDPEDDAAPGDPEDDAAPGDPEDDAAPGVFWLPHAVMTSPDAATAKTPRVTVRLRAPALVTPWQAAVRAR
jgi:hypothetical protein